MRTCAVLALLAIFPVPLRASLELKFAENAERTSIERVPFESYEMPIGPFLDGAIAVRRLEGAVSQSTWTIDGRDRTTLGVLTDQRETLEAMGFEPLYECDTESCGGFDFRFGRRVAPEPFMYVDLGDFRYSAMTRPGAPQADYVSLLVSRSADLAFVQAISVTPVAKADALPAAAAAAAAPPETSGTSVSDLADILDMQGRVVLDDLVFQTGSARLGEGEFASLEQLARYLASHPDRMVVLVGHTDTVGSLASNIELSRERARSVAAKLISDHAVAPAQVDADGIGFLAPRAGNLTEEGRAANRRVEAVLRADPR